METMLPSPAVDFNMESGCNTPYMSAPSSPPRIGATLFYSAPASPTRISPLHHWEEHVSYDKQSGTEDEDFAFDFSGQLERISLSAADELFDGGKIKPLKPRSHYDVNSPKSPKKLFRKKDFVEKESGGENPLLVTEDSYGGRRRSQKMENSSTTLRVSDVLLGDDESTKKSSSVSSSSSSSSSLSSSYFWSKTWKLKDLFLFRSASEGRVSSREQLNKYEVLKKSHQEDVKNSSFRSTESSSSVVGAPRRKRRTVSAHELHYTLNRAVSEEMKKKTSLPYRQGLLGCLGFNASVQDSVSKSVASSMSMPR